MEKNDARSEDLLRASGRKYEDTCDEILHRATTTYVEDVSSGNVGGMRTKYGSWSGMATFLLAMVFAAIIVGHVVEGFGDDYGMERAPGDDTTFRGMAYPAHLPRMESYADGTRKAEWFCGGQRHDCPSP